MHGNKELAARILYAAVAAIRSLPIATLFSTTALHRIQQDAVASKR
jgi:hypothetical protein